MGGVSQSNTPPPPRITGHVRGGWCYGFQPSGGARFSGSSTLPAPKIRARGSAEASFKTGWGSGRDPNRGNWGYPPPGESGIGDKFSPKKKGLKKSGPRPDPNGYHPRVSPQCLKRKPSSAAGTNICPPCDWRWMGGCGEGGRRRQSRESPLVLLGGQ